MHVVLEPVRDKGEHHACGEGGGAAPGQVEGKHEDAGRGQNDAGEEQEVVHEDRREPDPQQRRSQQRLDRHRIRKRQGSRLGVEDVAIEDMKRRRGERVRDPAEAPHVEEDVMVLPRRRGEAGGLRPRHDDGQQRKERDDPSETGHRIRILSDRCRSSASAEARSSTSPVRREADNRTACAPARPRFP